MYKSTLTLTTITSLGHKTGRLCTLVYTLVFLRPSSLVLCKYVVVSCLVWSLIIAINDHLIAVLPAIRLSFSTSSLLLLFPPIVTSIKTSTRHLTTCKGCIIYIYISLLVQLSCLLIKNFKK